MDARIYTYEYPYPADVQSIRQVVRNPEKSGRQIPVSMLGPEMTFLLGGRIQESLITTGVGITSSYPPRTISPK